MKTPKPLKEVLRDVLASDDPVAEFHKISPMHALQLVSELFPNGYVHRANSGEFTIFTGIAKGADDNFTWVGQLAGNSVVARRPIRSALEVEAEG